MKLKPLAEYGCDDRLTYKVPSTYVEASMNIDIQSPLLAVDSYQ